MQYKGDPTLALVGCFLRDGRKILGRERIGGARATYYFLLDFFFLLNVILVNDYVIVILELDLYLKVHHKKKRYEHVLFTFFD